jgi:hypothetical protein
MPKAREPHTLPTADEVRALLDYEPETGVLRWKPRPGQSQATRRFNTLFAGKVAGAPGTKGAIYLGLLGQRFLAHRVIWAIVKGEWPINQIDHRDLNPANNRLKNLREATNGQNGHNKRAQKNSPFGLKGVHWDKRIRRYRARIGVDGQYIFLGHFRTPEAAYAAYVAAAEKHFGEFARTA